MYRNFTIVLILITCCLSPVLATDREDEIRTQMWSSSDKQFKVIETPDKWKGKSAIIIAQLNRFEYRKPVMLNQLRYNEYNHFRIKLNDKNAITKYAEISYGVSGAYNKVYVGFKVIKPGGKEIIVDHSTAVTMERESGMAKQSYKKIAIPGLEAGDILDYYICEESSIQMVGWIYFFDPVIHTLPGEYPIMNHKLQFEVERKCFINLVSLNGAPQLKLVTENKDEEYYSLDINDLEAAEDQRWIFKYRELPAVKFRVAFATGKAMRTFDVLLGEQGKPKSSVTKGEVEDMAGTMLMTAYDVKFISKHAKTKLKGEKDPFVIARECYYFYRNNMFSAYEESVVDGGGANRVGDLRFADVFSTFLTSKKIQHDILIAVPRNISSLDNLLMENEIEWLIRVRKGKESLYLSPFDFNTIPGTISPLLEGTEAYALNMPSGIKNAQKITLPVTEASDNKTQTTMLVDLKSADKAKISLKKTITGDNKRYDQYMLMDIYDAEGEEKSRFKMEDSFAKYTASARKKYTAMREAYKTKRDADKTEALKYMLENDYDFACKEPGNLKIEQTGRYHTSPAFVYTFTFETEELMKKTGPNYLIDAGKLIEEQTKIEGDELERKSNIYFDNARTFEYAITIEIPSGYSVQGLDKFTQNVVNTWGGFTSKAREENGKIIIETKKFYNANFVPKDQWPKLLEFLNAAHTFTEQKILLKKI
ncbi:MAG TPA: DUF3857 domain-containing protein [Ohtaekwangia sp.]